ncbi:tandem-95 repeat protein, partial [Polaribacter aestuariivivens]
MHTIFNLKDKTQQQVRKILLVLVIGLLSSFSYAQGVNIIVNATTPNGSDNAGDTIEYTASVINSGGTALNAVTFTSSLGTTMTLDSGDTNNNAILDVNECWIYKGTHTITAAEITATKIDNTFSLNATELTSAQTFMYTENVHEDDISFASVIAINDIDAVNDDFSTTVVNGITGGASGDITTNDLLNGVAVTDADINITIENDGGLTGVTVDTNGNVNVPANSATGTYTITYKICEKVNTTNCDTATAIVKVDGDTDGDGVLDSVDKCNGFDDNADNDNDGVADGCDLDDDNDGILDTAENATSGDPFVDTNNNGILDYQDPALVGFVDGNSDNIDDRYDLDQDGKIDQFDTDADGDGCNDVIEAGHKESATKPGEVSGTGYSSTDGKVTGFTTAYTGTNSNVSSAGTAPTITAQPPNRNIIVGGTTTFSVTTDGNVFQWELSTNGGATYNTILNGSVYSGTTTNTLTISGVTAAQNNYKFRVIVSKTDYVCPITSNAGTLTTFTNDPPVASSNAITVDEESLATSLGFTAPTDPDGNTLTITVTGLPTLGVVKKANGDVVANGATLTPAEVAGLTYDAPAEYNGTDDPGDFTYTVSDGIAPPVTGTGDITVTAINDLPVAVGESGTALEDNPITLTTIGANDTDEDGNVVPSTIILIDPTNAANTGKTGTPLVIAGKGTYTVDAAGTVVFTPEANFNGTADIKYTIKDDSGFTSNEATLGFTITPVNDVPVAVADVNSTTENTTLTVTAANGVLSNDSDVDVATTLNVTTFTIDGQTKNANETATIIGVGTLQINDDGSYVFTPDTNYTGVVPVATYNITDNNPGTPGTASSILTITIDPDSDNDGVADKVDLDSDNDGILDIVEGQGIDPTADADGDGILNYLDADFPGGTAQFDFDGDGIPNHLDLDSDNDAIPDVLEAGYADTNNDGIADASATPALVGANGFGNVLETAPESGVAATAPRNTDASSDIVSTLINSLDRDSDNDGISDTEEAFSNNATFNDTDNNGVIDGFVDADNNGWDDRISAPTLATFPTFLNSDTDALPNYLDLDSDGDGLPDTFEGNFQVTDGDNNGIVGTGIPADSDADGLADTNDPDFAGNILGGFGFNQDRDGDGVKNYLDIDIDNDGILDNIEGQSTAQYKAPTGTDSDNDGIDDAYDVDATGGIAAGYTNTDGGSAPDYADTDAENDGINDINEGFYKTIVTTNNLDADSNGIVDVAKFVDADGDGLHDDFDEVSGTGTTNNATNGGQTPNTQPDVDPAGGDRDWREASNQDNDGDGINDIVDLDDDNDGILDTDEDLNADLDNDPRTDPTDSDGDGIPNYFDLDSDNDGIPDYYEAGGTNDPDKNGQPGTGTLTSSDVNANGIPLDVSTDTATTGTATTSNLALPNTDGDARRDFLDIDSDNDGIVDAIEAGGTDPDGDGEIGSGTANDADSDGLADSVDPVDQDPGGSSGFNAGTPLTIPNSDNDTIPNHLDLDSDNDTIPDNIEAQTTAGYIAPSATFTDTDEDGLDDAYDTTDGGTAIIPVNTDGTDNPDYLDLDSDNDLIKDIVEFGNATNDTNGNGQTNETVGTNGLDNTVEAADTFADVNGNLDNTQADNSPDEDNDVASGGDVDYRDILDNDNDGVADAVDLDDDNDGILDTVESPGNVNPDADSDNDGTQDFKDSDYPGFVDTNSDGINDNFDTDLDGIPNHQDTDSDNDSCPDAVEAGFTESTTKPGEVSGTGYETDGTVTGASYSGTNVNVTTAGTPVVISTQPSDQNGFINGSVTFEVVSTGNVFQWQESTDGGTTFTDITNGGIYSGATTNQLSVSNLTTTQNGYKYQVIVSKTDYACDIPSTPPATLTVSNNPPVAVDDLNNTTNEDTPITVSTIAANDTDVEDTTPDASTIILIDPDNASNTGKTGTPLVIANVGTYTVDPLGNVTFTPVLNFNGDADIKYTIKDSSNNTSNQANIDIVVTDVNDAPVANNDSSTGLEGAVQTLTTIGANDTDVDGTIDPTTVILIDPSNPSNTGTTGTPLVIANVGTYTVNGAGTVVFTPLENFNGSADIFYTIKDDDGLVSNQATLDITVTPVNDAPVAQPDSGTSAEDVTLNVAAADGLLKNDSDVDANPLSVTKFVVDGTTVTVDPTSGGSTTIVGKGTITINADGSYTFVPVADFNGTVPQVTYTVSDGTNSVNSTLDITITPVNDDPVLVADTNSTNEDVTLTVTGANGVLKNDTDVDAGTTLTVSSFTIAGVSGSTNAGDPAVTIPNVGTFQMNADGGYVFAPAQDYVGAVPVITYTATDGTSPQTSTLTITIVPQNDAPVAVDDTATVNEDTTLTVAKADGLIDDNDTDVDGDTLNITQFVVGGTTVTVTPTTPGVRAIPNVGTITINTDGSYSFVPVADFNGTVPEITYTISDGTNTDNAKLNITVTPVNDAPIAVDDTYTTNEDTSVALLPLTGDSDIDGDTLTITSINGTTLTPGVAQTITVPNGVVTTTVSGVISFAPTANYNGTSTFAYVISDGNGETATANQIITVNAVNDAPVANPDTASLAEDTTLTVAKADGLIDLNDTDIDGDILAITQFVVNGTTVPVDLTTGGTRVIPNVGTLTINADGSYSFEPVANFNGTVPQVTYTVSDGTNTANSTLNITVTPVNDVPVAVDDTYTTNEDTSVALLPLTGDSDIDGDTLTITSINGTTLTPGVAQTITVPNGVVTTTVSGVISFAPTANYNGTSTFAYVISDGNGETATANQIITVNAVNDAPVANPDTASIAEDTTLTVAKADGLIDDNDTDVDGDTLNVTQFVVGGTTVTVTPTTPGVSAIPNVGTITINTDGSYSFVPVADFNGTVPQITYTVSDGTNTANSTLNITVTPVNDDPVLVADTNSTNEDVTLTVTGTNGVLKNDTDVDAGTTLTVSSFTIAGISGSTNAGDPAVTIPNVGTFQMNADGGYVFAPAQDYVGAVPVITYTATDGTSPQTSTLTITIVPQNDAPVAVDDTATVNEDTTLTVAKADGLIDDNDTDVDGDTLNVTQFVVSGTTVTVTPTTPGVRAIPNVGTITINTDGSYSFVPVADFNGTVPEITYTISDGTNTDNAKLNITVTPVNDDPVATNDTTGTDPGVAVDIPVLTNDNDLDGDTIIVSSITAQPSNGTATINSDGTIKYTPNSGFNNGSDSFTYEISDGNGGTDTAVVTVTVPISPFPPVANPDTNSVNEDTTLTVSAANGILKNDTDGNLDALKVVSYTIAGIPGTKTPGTITSIPNVGSIKINQDGSYEFIPVANFNGAVPEITYTVTDSSGLTTDDTSTLNITVNPTNDAPVAVADTNTTPEDTKLTVTAANGVLKNDSDLDGDAISVKEFEINGTTTTVGTAVTLTEGVFTLLSDGSYTFTPAEDFNGNVPEVTYTMTDGTVDVMATLNISVTPVNDPPVAVDNLGNVANEDNPVTIAAIGTNDTDDGTIDPSTVRLIDPNNASNFGNSSTPLVISGVGTYTVNANGDVVFTPVANFNGPANIKYTIKDNEGVTSLNQATIGITITPTNDVPVAVADTNTVDEGATLTVTAANGLLKNDSDVDNDPLTVTQITIGGTSYPAGTTVTITEGTLVVKSDGSYTFTPAGDFNGDIPQVTYTVSDGTTTTTATLDIKVNPVNDRPVANPDTNSTDEDTLLSVSSVNGILKNDTDVDNDPLVVTGYTVNGGTRTINTDVVLTEGTLNIKADGSYTFQPALNFNGDVPQVTYTVSDGNLSATSTLDIKVNPINDAPTAVPDTDTVAEDVTLTVTAANGVLKNDSDIDMDALTVTNFTVGGTTYNAGDTVPLTEGSLKLNSDGSYSFTPTANFNGTVPTITYTVSDGTNTSNTTLQITVTPVNDAPDLVADTNTTIEDTQLTVAAANGVLKNDTDKENNTITVTKFTVGGTDFTAGATAILTEGTLKLNADGGYVFNPAPNFNGAYPQVTYTATDGTDTATSTLDITVLPVNDSPVALTDTNSTNEDTPLNVLAANGLLKNDTDPENDPLTVTQFTVGGNTFTAGSSANITEGTIKINSDGSYTFTPATDYNGPVPVINYTISDGTNTAISTLTLTVNTVNDAPTAVADTNTTVEDTQLTVTAANGVLKNDSDIDGDVINVSGFVVEGTSYLAGETATTAAGTIKLDSNGGYTYVPANNFNGAVPQVTYTITDGVLTASSTLDITVTPVNDSPIAVADTNATDEDVALNVPAATGLLNNDSDPEGNPITVSNFTINGTVYTAGTSATITEGVIKVNADGSYSFTPALNYDGAVPVVNYTITDGSNTANSTLTLTINSVNDAPTAVADTNTTAEDVTLTVSVANGVLKNDSDFDADTITVTQFEVGGTTVISGNPISIAEGTITINTNGDYVFVPAANFNGTVPTITYTVSDGTDVSTATLIITVTPVNDTPNLVADTNTTPEDTVLSVNAATGVLSNDNDIDGDTVTVSKFTVGGVTYNAGQTATIPSGTIKLNADGSYDYTPALNFNGTVPTITYTATDGVNTANSTLKITVTPVNDNPVAVDDTSSTDPGVSVNIPVLTNDSDLDGDVLSVSAITVAPTKGTAVIFDNGTPGDTSDDVVTYTPQAGFNNGTDTFTYQISDGNGGFDTAVVTITVPQSAFSPVANPDTNVTDEEVTLTVADGAPKSLIKNDTDANLDPITVTKFVAEGTTYNAGDTANLLEGDLTINAGGGYVFVPKPDFNGVVPAVSYTITDGQGTPNASSTLTITVNPINDAPIANPDVKTTLEDTTLTVSAANGLLDNDTDIDGDVLSVKEFEIGGTTYTVGVAVNLPEGSLTINSDGSYTFVPTPDSTADLPQVTYTITDGTVDIVTSTLDISVTGVNDAPVAVDDLGNTTNEDTNKIIATIGANDTDDGGIDVSTITLIDPSNPANTGQTGTPLVITGVGTYTVDNLGNVTFDPEDNYNGSANINYTIKDNDPTTPLTSNVATIGITVISVNDIPVVQNETDTTPEDTQLVVSGTSTDGLLNNDTDADGDPLTISTFTIDGDATVYNSGTTATLTEGTLKILADGGYVFTPASDFNGTVPQVTYNVTDGNVVTPIAGTLDITVTPINDAPIAVNDLGNVTNEDTDIIIPTIGGNDTDDVAIDASTVTLIDPNNPSNTGNSTTPLLITGVGTYSVDNLGNVTFDPVDNYNGPANVNYTIQDNDPTTPLTSNVATIGITVTSVNDVPVVQNETNTTPEDVQLVVSTANGLLNNDSDPDGDPLTISTFVAEGTTYNAGDTAVLNDGTLKINPDGSYIFTPNADFNGAIPKVIYNVTDGVDTVAGELDITVGAVNDAPVAVDDLGNTTNEDTEVVIATIVANDTDDSGINPATVTLIDPSDPSNTGNSTTPLIIPGVGTYTVDNLGNVTFDPADHYNGAANVNYTVQDNDPTTPLTSNVATIGITVADVNDPPIVVDEDTINLIFEDTPYTASVADGLLVNDSDIDGDALSISTYIVDGKTYNAGQSANLTEGTLKINSDGSYTFTPALNYFGSVPPITYNVSDGTATTPASLTISVIEVNDPPVAVADTNTINEDTVLTVSEANGILANDSDIENDVLTVTALMVNGNPATVGSPISLTEGVLTIQSNGSYVFTPAPNFNGAVPTVTYTVSDGIDTATSTLKITVLPVNDVPIAVADTNTTPEDVAITVNATNGLLKNDSDPENNSLTVTRFTVGGTTYVAGNTVTLTEGSLVINSDGSYTFTPAANYNGTVPTISYTLSDGTNTANSTLDITVTPINDAPVATDDISSTDPGVSVIIPVLPNDTDIDGDTLTVSGIVTPPANGTVTINGDGTITYTPNPGFNTGTDVFVYQVCDGNGLCDTATVSVKVPKSLLPPVANPDVRFTSEDVTLTVAAANGLLNNDTDANPGETLTVTKFQVNGTNYNPGDTVTITEGTITINADGSYTYVPAANYNGPVPVINYTISDGTGTALASSTLTITVTGVNDAPVANPDTDTTPEDTQLSVSAANGLIKNDLDPDGTPLTLTQFVVNGTSYAAGTTVTLTEGSLTVNGDGSYTFNPAKDYVGTVPQVTYTVTDGVEIATTTLDITVTGVNDAPIAVNDSATTLEDTPVTIANITGNDTDDDTVDPSTVVLIDPNNPANTGNSSTPLVISGVGTYTVDNLGNVTFTPESNFNGSADINYTVKDNDGLVTSTPAKISIAVTPVNDVPIVVADVNSTTEDTPLTVSSANGVLANDSDVEGTLLTVLEFTINGTDYPAGTIATITEGTLEINSDGSYTYTPALDFVGSVPQVTYTVSDGVSIASTTLDITVTGQNDAPVAVDNSETTVQNTPVTVATIAANDTDADGTVDPSTVILIDPNNPNNTGNSTTPLVIANVGTYTVDAAGNVIFTPEPDFTGVANINYTVKDDLGLISNIAKITITVQSDNDGDGIIDIVDLDDDNDGIPDTVENGGDDPLKDTDNDGIPDFRDPDNITKDDNNDGIDDKYDSDGDGIIDQFDLDGDNDGIPDLVEGGGIDTDGDGKVDNFTDTNNDGLDDNTATTPLTTPDTDGDGVPNYQDIDSDNDGIIDNIEGQNPSNYVAPSGTDTDKDGIDDAYDADCTPCGSVTGNPIITPMNSDSDAIPNYLDIDADNDGIVDNIEWQTTSGYIAPGPDTDGNGLADVYETAPGSGNPIRFPVNTDGTDTPDYTDTDSDGDGLLDTVEAYDTDGDNVAEPGKVFTGVDSDNDGLDDAFDLNSGGSTDPNGPSNDMQDVTAFPNDQDPGTAEVDFRDKVTFGVLVDTDGDGITDDIDIDDDNDGIIDVVESLGFEPSANANYPNCILPNVSFRNPVYVAGTGVTGSGSIGAKYRFENVVDVTGFGGSGGILDAIVEITDIQGGASLISIDNSTTGNPDAWQPEYTVPTPTGNKAEMAFKVILVNDNTNTLYNISRFSGVIYDIDGANARESVILSRPGLYAVDNATLLNVTDNPATGLVTFQGPDDTYSGVDLSPRLATFFGYYNSASFNIRFSAELLSATSNTNLGSVLFSGCAINGLFDASNTTSATASQANGVSLPSGPGTFPVFTVNDGIDSDGDGKSDDKDIDSDNDGIPDNVEAQVTGSGYIPPNVGIVDSDNDGLLDAYDDNAVISGLSTVDTDGDKIPDYLDTDSDNDGIDDTKEAGFVKSTANNDADNDGLLDAYDDVPTIGTLFDVNDDQNAGASDLPNLDNPSNPEVDFREIKDNDGDGVPDSVDLDDDNDGIPDLVEQNGNPNRDTDGDNIPDHLDLDSDGDGVNDLTESGFGQTDLNNDGIIDGSDIGSGANGLFDLIETTPESGVTQDTPQDTDKDGIPDFQDTDDDGDGILTKEEDVVNVNGDPQDDDSDGDGIPNYLDIDDDNDGVPTKDEDNNNNGDFTDDDDNNDGTPDYLDNLDTDKDGIPDSEDPDDDNDGNPDVTDPNPLVPTVGADILTVVEGIPGKVNILTNDDYLPGPNTTIVDAGTGTATGVVTFDPLTGEMTYTSAPGEEGTTVTVDYTVCNTAVNPAVCRTSTVTITVQNDNDNDGDPDVTDPDDDNDGNPDTTDPNPLVPTVSGDVLTVVEGVSGTVNILTNDDYLPGPNTTIVDAGTGTATGVVTFDPLTGEMTYTSAPGEEGTTVTVDYTVCNTAVNPAVCSTATVTITVQPDNDKDGIPDVTDPDDDNDGNPDTTDPNPLDPTVADDVLTVVEGVPGTINILTNDDYLPGPNTTIVDAGTGTATGVVTFDPLTGEMTYTPAAGEEGTTVTVDYTVCNTAVNPAVCKTATVTITV